MRVGLAFVARGFAYQTFVDFVRFVGFAYQTIGLGGQSLPRHLYRPVAAVGTAVGTAVGMVVDTAAGSLPRHLYLLRHMAVVGTRAAVGTAVGMVVVGSPRQILRQILRHNRHIRLP